MRLLRPLLYPLFGLFVAVVWFPLTLVLSMVWQLALFGVGLAILALPVTAVFGGPAWFAANLAAIPPLYWMNAYLQPRMRIEGLKARRPPG